MKEGVINSKQSSFRELSIFLMFVLAVGFVLAFNHIAIVGGGDSIEVNEDISYGYNFTLNSTVENVSTVLFILPINFTFTTDTNGTSSLNPIIFTNITNGTNTILNWTNSTAGIVGNKTLVYTWFNATNNIPGSYNFTILMYNMTTAGYNANYTINITVNDTTAPNVVINNVNWGNFSGRINFNATVTDISTINYVYINVTNITNDKITQVELSLISGTNDYNYSLDTTTALTPDGFYNITVLANDTNNNLNNTEYITAYVDNTNPVVHLISPAAGNSVSTTTTSAFNFTFNVTDVGGLSNCILYFDGALTNKITAVNETGATMGMYNSSIQIGSHTWAVNCTDSAGNIGNSSIRTLTVTNGSTTTTSPGGGGSVGGGSGTNWKNTYILNDEDQTQFESANGFSRELNNKYRVRINIEGDNHYVGVTKITETSATFEVASDPQTLTLSLGEAKMFDVTDDGYYDLLITLNSIEELKANVTVKKVHEQIEIIEDESLGENEDGVDSGLIEDEKSLPWMWIGIVVAVIIILAGVGYLIYKKRQ